MKFKDSALAHFFLDGKEGIEVGGSAHNAFNIAGCKNVDYTDDMTTVYKKGEFDTCGEAMKVDVVADGAHLPFPDGSLDYVLSSHVMEHFKDPIGLLNEWLRVLRPGGYIFAIIPHKERTFDKDRPRTTLNQLIERHANPDIDLGDYGHYSIWCTEDFLELCEYMKLSVVASQDVDDKVGNGFTVVIRK